MYKISVSKIEFENILLKKTKILKKDNTKYWKKELLEVKIINDKISYKIKQVDTLFISNGLQDDKPLIKVECLKVDYSSLGDCFEFYLGKILEQKNISINDNYKDILIEKLIREKHSLEDKINRDHLTNLYNRRKMNTDLDIFVKQRNSFLLACIFVDADRFKGINDNFGHDTGDKVLEYIAKKLLIYAHKLNGEVYRYGGEEFVIFSFIAKDRLFEILEILRKDIKAQKIYHPKHDLSISISLGVSFYKDYYDKEIFMKRADEALYLAKNNGRDRLEVL